MFCILLDDYEVLWEEPNSPLASQVAQWQRICLPMQEKQVRSLGQEDPLEKEIATHSHILAWGIPGTEEPGGLQSMRSERVGHDWALNTLGKFSEVSVFSLKFCWISLKKYWVTMRQIPTANKETQGEGFKTHMVLTFGTLNVGTPVTPNL